MQGQVAMDNVAVVMVGFVVGVRMHMDERRRSGAHLQAEAHEQGQD